MENAKDIVVIEVKYTGEVDNTNFSKLICKMSNGEEKFIHYDIDNPMPKEYILEGQTWEFVRGFCMGMWRMAIDEKKIISYTTI